MSDDNGLTEGLWDEIVELEAENVRLERAWLALQKRASADRVVELEAELQALRGENRGLRELIATKHTWELKRIGVLELEIQALRESNRVALAEAYRCGYEAGKAELQDKLDEARKLGLYWQAEAETLMEIADD